MLEERRENDAANKRNRKLQSVTAKCWRQNAKKKSYRGKNFEQDRKNTSVFPLTKDCERTLLSSVSTFVSPG